MSRDKEKKFSAKHGADAQADPTVRQRIESYSEKGEVACAVAFKIGEELELPPADIGRAIDLLELKITQCQLGLFGYGSRKKAFEPKAPENQRLEAAIRDALNNERLACRDAWDIARRFDLPKMAVSAACDALEIKIKPCQLGAF